MSHRITRDLYLGMVEPKPSPASDNVIRPGSEVGRMFTLAAGTYTIANGVPPQSFWVKAAGAVTITGVTTLSTGQVAMIVADSTSSWAATIVPATFSEGAAAVGFADANGYTGLTNLEAVTDALLREARVIRIPLTSFVDPDGDPVIKFSAAPAPGFTKLNSEALGIQWAANATHNVITTTVQLPVGATTWAAQVNIICSKTGATVGDATTFTITAFEHAVGALHDAGDDLGGVSTALVGNATAKTVQRLTLTLDTTSGTAHSALTLTLGPTAGTLGTDNLLMESIYLVLTAFN